MNNLIERIKDKSKLSKKVKFENLPLLVVDGKVLAEVGSYVAFKRKKDGKVRSCVGFIKSLSPDLLIWDETYNQYFNTSLGKEDLHYVDIRMLQVPETK